MFECRALVNVVMKPLVYRSGKVLDQISKFQLLKKTLHYGVSSSFITVCSLLKFTVTLFFYILTPKCLTRQNIWNISYELNSAI